MPQFPQVGEDVSHLFSNGPDIGSDVSHLFDEPSPRKRPQPVAGDTFADKIANAASAIGHTAVGTMKGAAHTALDAVGMGMRAGVIPGGTAFGTPGVDYLRDQTAYDGTAEKVGGALETAAELYAPAVEVGKLALAGAKGAAGLAGKLPLGKVGSVAADLAEEALPLGRVARRVLRYALNTATKKAAPEAAVAAKSAASATVPASFSGTAALPESVPSMGGFSMPPSVPRAAPPSLSGRVVPAQEPTFSQALTDSLAEMRAETPMPRVTTPPEPSLPAGYTPRTTVPKPKAVKMAAPAAEPTAPPKRAYFLKSEADLAPVAPSPKPSGTVSPDELPASWQKHIGQDIFPLTGKEGADVAAALVEELRAQGMSVGQAMMAVSKNPDIPVQYRQQLLKSLSRVNMKGAQ